MTALPAIIRRGVWLGFVLFTATSCQPPEAFRRSVGPQASGDGALVPVVLPDAGAASVSGVVPDASGSDGPPPAPPEPAAVVGGVDPCARRNWTFIPRFVCDTPACQEVPPSAKNPFGAIDGMPDTRYTTGRGQGSDGPESVVLQLPRLASLTGVTLLATIGDGPATYLVEYSLDGRTFDGFQPPVFGAGSDATAISFPATTMLAVRITQTGVKATNWWSISELNVVGCAPR